MSKKVILFFVSIIFTFPVHFVFAGLIINEVMYDLSGADSVSSKSREWIEVYNPDGDVSIDASKWRIYDGSANRTMNGQVDFFLPSGSYTIFAGDKDTFLADYPSFSGVVYDTGISSLNNTGATLKILDQDGNTVDSADYNSGMGGAGDGNSLQKISGSWVGAIPIPGVTNETVSPPIPPSGGGGLASGASSGGDISLSVNTTTKKEEPRIKTQIKTNPVVFASIPLLLQATSFGYSKEQLYSGRYFWNFGDGDSKEVTAIGLDKIMHTYPYPGDYIVTLQYYVSSYGDIPDAFDKLTIKVVPADILISKVGSDSDFFVELSNNTNYDADVSGWVLISDIKSFIMPKNTIIGAKKKMTISSQITKFSVEDKNSLKLMTPEKKVVFDYAISVAPIPQATFTKISVSPKIITTQSENKITQTEDIQVPPTDLQASTLQSSVITSNSSTSKALYIVFVIFLGVVAGIVYFVRRNKIPSVAGEDFNILDE